MLKKPKKRRVSPERATRRSAILASAVKLFAERGIANVTFGDIARKARLSRPLVYFYFTDMETLFMEATLLASARMHARFLAALRPADSGLDQIVSIGRAYVDFARDDGPHFDLLAHAESSKSKDTGEEHPLLNECERQYETVMGLLVSSLRKGLRDGSIRRDVGDPAKVAVCLWGLTHGLIQITNAKQETLEKNLGPSFARLPDFGLDLVRRSLQAK